jgi:nicotinamidase-related amidase
VERHGGRSALLVIDLQNEFVAGEHPLFNADVVISRVNELAQKARSAGALVVFTQHDGGDLTPARGTEGWELSRRLEVQGSDLIVEKRYCDAFYASELHAALNSRNVSRLVVSGCISELCVDTTVRRAMTLGYRVCVAEDAHSTVDATVPPYPPPAVRIAWTNLVLSRLPVRDQSVVTAPSEAMTW